jgi:hypothetical protein
MNVTLGVKCKVQRSYWQVLTKVKAAGSRSILIEFGVERRKEESACNKGVL